MLALEAEALALLQVLGADVGGHDDDGVLEVDGVAEAVGELAVFKDLKQDVEDIRVRLLDLVEQDDGVGRTLDALGELAALLVADIARRRADELGDGVLLHELRHIEADEGLLRAEEEVREGARHLGFADAGGAEEEEAADGARGVLEAGARAANGAGQGGDGLVLEMTRLCSSSSTRRSFCVSSSLMEVMGTPVQRLTTSSMSSRVTMPAEESSRWYLSRRVRRFSRSLRSSSE